MLVDGAVLLLKRPDRLLAHREMCLGAISTARMQRGSEVRVTFADPDEAVFAFDWMWKHLAECYALDADRCRFLQLELRNGSVIFLGLEEKESR